MKSIERSLKDVKEGKVRTEKQLLKELNIDESGPQHRQPIL
jgi:hypothetical protein